MTADQIQLNPEKINYLIALSGKRKKQLLGQRNRRTLSRILKHGNTTQATAASLASDLGVTVADLISPLQDDDFIPIVPPQWVYEEIGPPLSRVRHMPACPLLASTEYVVSCGPLGVNSPLDQILQLNLSRAMKIVLRRESFAFIFEVHYFEYEGRDQEVHYTLTTGCRFFPLVRNGDTFSKSALPKGLNEYVWRSLQAFAMSRAEILEVDGGDRLCNPHEYHPLVRFFRGPLLSRSMHGARLFRSFHSDFRSTLIEHLETIAPARFRAFVTSTGLGIRVAPLPPELHRPGWREEVDILAVDLVARLPSGPFQIAPWRETDRVACADALNSRNWRDFHSPRLPLHLADWPDELADLKMTPDQRMSQEDLGVCASLYNGFQTVL